MKLRVIYALEKMVYVLFGIYASQGVEGRHNEMCNRNFWKGRFQNTLKNCGFLLKDRRQDNTILIINKAKDVAIKCTPVSEMSVLGEVLEWTMSITRSTCLLKEDSSVDLSK